MSSTNNPKPTDYSQINKLRNNRTFKALMEQAIELAGDMKVLSAQYDETKAALDTLLQEVEVKDSVMYNGWRLNVVDAPGKPRLNMTKLLRLLGPKGPSIVKQAMDTPGKDKHYVQITPPKVDNEDDE